MAGRGEVLIRILGDSSSLDAALGETTSKLSAFGSALTSPAGLAVAAGVVIAGALFKIGEDFNNAFITIRRNTGATGTELQALEQDFKNVVSTVPAKFGDAALAVSKLHNVLGISGGALDKEAEQVLELNRITGGVLSETVAGATDLFNNWQISTKNQSGALDELFRASQLSGANIQTLFADMKAGGGIMREMGFNFDQTITIMSGFEKAGLNTQQILAGMRMGLGKFAKANEEPQQAFERLVQEIQNAPTRIQGSADAIKIFGTRSGAGLADAIQTGRISFDDLMKGITQGSDTIRKAGADTMTLGDEWRLLKNEVFVALQPVATAFFGAILSGVQAVVGGFKDVSGWVGEFVNDWNNGTDTAGVGASTFASAVHTIWSAIKADVKELSGIWQPVADAIGSVADSIGGFFSDSSPAVSSLKGIHSNSFRAANGLALIRTPSGWSQLVTDVGNVATAIGEGFQASTTFLKEFQTDWETGSNKAGVAAGKMKDVVHAVWAWLRQAFEDFKGFISDFSDDWANGSDKVGISVGKIATVVHKLWDTIQSIFEAMKAYWTIVFTVLGAVVLGAVKFIEDLWTRFGQHLIDHLRTTWSNMLSIISGALDVIKGIFDIFAGIFTLNFSKVWQGIQEVLSGVWNTMVALVKEAINIISTVIGLAMAIISEVWGYAWGGIKGVVGAIWGEITGEISGAFNTVMGIFYGSLGVLSGAWSGFWSGVGDVASGAVGTVTGAAQAVINGVKDVWNTIANFINSQHIDIPSVDLGPLGTVGGGTISFPHIPTLAKGGVVPNPTLAVVGDAGPGNPEIVTPEKLMRQIVKEELSTSGGSGHTIIVNGNVYDPHDMHRILDDRDRHMRRRMRTRRT